MANILIVDDDEAILDAISLTLEDVGYHVNSTSKGEEAIDRVSNLNPNLILLDVLMSGVDGREICMKLKDSKDFRHIPIVMISAHPSAKEDSLKCGADDFLPKPFDSQVLVDTVAKYVTKK